MDTQIAEAYKKAVVRIAGTGGWGTGFYVKEFGLIITNNHLLGDKGEIAIEGDGFEKVFTPILFLDSKLDIAFLEVPEKLDLPEIKLGNYSEVKDGDAVTVIANPYGGTYIERLATVLKAERIRDGLRYIQVNLRIPPENSGGPLVNEKGEVIGINLPGLQQGGNVGFALPVSYIRDALKGYQPIRGKVASRCSSCDFLVTAANIVRGKSCPSCGSQVKLPELDSKPTEPVGIAKTIEEILHELGKNVKVAREGTNSWSIKEGSARVSIKYNPNNEFVIGDAYLCQMPSDMMAIKRLYVFLLQENYQLSDLVLSCSGQNILLSCIMFSGDMTKESATKTFRHLFQKADHYDDFLKTQYGCPARLEESA
jgi:serine protease Do